jgi:hypothetical protein
MFRIGQAGEIGLLLSFQSNIPDLPKLTLPLMLAIVRTKEKVIRSGREKGQTKSIQSASTTNNSISF